MDHAALWVQRGWLAGTAAAGFDLVHDIPGAHTARFLDPDHSVSVWASSVGRFGWMACEEPPEGLITRRRMEGVFFLFAQESRLVLGVNLKSEPAPVEGVQSKLSDLHNELVLHLEAGRGSQFSHTVSVDIGFLEAMAMGDDSFVSHMLELSLGELASGSEVLAEALVGGRGAELGYQAHKLRSTARTIGAEALDAVLEAVENDAPRGDYSSVSCAIRIADQTMSAVTRILRERPLPGASPPSS